MFLDISVTVQKDQLTTIYEELKNRYDNLSNIYNQTTFEEKQLKEKCQSKKRFQEKKPC